MKMQRYSDSHIEGVLGPTNTGKTHYAIERLCSFKSGCIGFPLRLLARENYDRLVHLKGRHNVALITGEEKIIPLNAKYYVCTVESMPIEEEFEFIAIDEVQLAADPDRGHIFTDRILRCRGSEETLFLGSDTIQTLLKTLVPGIEIKHRQRLSTLSYIGFKKITRLPKRSAIVAFSIDDVYNVADLIRRQKGGTAIVLGALSPRTRNAQVEMYQSGEVDYLVATDAIGMGLNMDIHHVALASVRKFDGLKPRNLTLAEMAQIAGRAGRYKRDGTFGVTGHCRNMETDEFEAIQNNQFDAINEIYWRNYDLDFQSPTTLLSSLEKKSNHPNLIKGRVSDDHRTLVALNENEDIMARASDKEQTQLLWDVCQIPDFRKTLSDKHEELVARIYVQLSEGNVLEESWVNKSIEQLDNIEGDADALMTRISHIRTWTYIAHRKEWHKDAIMWQEKARFIEDRLSDALHKALTKRFVDKRSAKIYKSLSSGQPLLAGVQKDGTVIVEGHRFGKLNGFRFTADEDTQGKDQRAVVKAAQNALKPEIRRRLNEMSKFNNTQFTLNDNGQVFWQPVQNSPLPGDPIAKLIKGSALLSPEIEILENGLLEASEKLEAKKYVEQWLDLYLREKLEALLTLKDDNLMPAARGIAWQVYEGLGVIPRAQIEDLASQLDDTARAQIRSKKIMMGPILIFLPLLNKPAAIRLRALLWGLWNDKELPINVPKDGVVSEDVQPDNINKEFYQMIGYPVYANKAIRIDMLDRVVVDIYDNSKDWQFRAQHKYCEWLGCTIDDLYKILESMGHKKIEDKEEQTETTTTEESASTEASENKENEEEKKPTELSLFQLRRGKMAHKAKDKKPFKQKSQKAGNNTATAKSHKGKKKPNKHPAQKPKTHSFTVKTDDENASPFAVLEQLKDKTTS